MHFRYESPPQQAGCQIIQLEAVVKWYSNNVGGGNIRDGIYSIIQGPSLPPSIEDLISEDHICFLVEALVDSMDFSTFDLKHAGAGHLAYHPRVLLKVLVMGVMDRVRSSRRLAKNARENVVYMYLSEKLTPDFRTISDFRKNNPDVVKKAFRHTVEPGKREGLLDLSHLSTDGSKIKANASNKRVLTGEELEFLLRFVDEELEEWASQDKKGDDIFGNLRGFDQLPGRSKRAVQKAAQYYTRKLRERGNVFNICYVFSR